MKLLHNDIRWYSVLELELRLESLLTSSFDVGYFGPFCPSPPYGSNSAYGARYAAPNARQAPVAFHTFHTKL